VQPKRLVLVDAGGVVLDGLATHHVVTEVAIVTGAAEPNKVRAFFDGHVNVPSTLGNQDEWWVFEQLAERYGPVDANQLARVAREKTQGLPGVTEVLTELRERGVAVWMLSNYIAEWLRDALRLQGLDEYFGNLYISSETRLRKPGLAAFQQVVSDWGGAPESIAFVDDKMVNVKAAEAVGMHGIHSVSDPKHWETEVLAWLDGSPPAVAGAGR
jgi:HAD superfamily hydrolase (TIGR01509 family)